MEIDLLVKNRFVAHLEELNCEFLIINEVEFFFEENDNKIMRNFFQFFRNFGGKSDFEIIFNSSCFFESDKIKGKLQKFFGQVNLIKDKDFNFEFDHDKINGHLLNLKKQILILEKIIKKSDIQQFVIFGANFEESQKIFNFLKQKDYQIENLFEINQQSINYKSIENFKQKNFNILICNDFHLRGLNFDFPVHIINFNGLCDFNSLFHRFEIGRNFSGKKFKVTSFLEKQDFEVIKKLESILKY